MQWCQKHWNGLRDEVKRQGLDALVASSGKEIAGKMQREINEGESSIDTFDPLMGAMWAINSFIGDQMGPGGQLTVLMHDGCPVCKADEVHDEHCQDEGCTYTIAQFFPNAVADQRKAWEAMRP